MEERASQLVWHFVRLIVYRQKFRWRDHEGDLLLANRAGTLVKWTAINAWSLPKHTAGATRSAQADFDVAIMMGVSGASGTRGNLQYTAAAAVGDFKPSTRWRSVRVPSDNQLPVGFL